jgi:hypothetical protein
LTSAWADRRDARIGIAQDAASPSLRVPSHPSCRTGPGYRHVPKTLAPSSVSSIVSIPKPGLTRARAREARPRGRGGIGDLGDERMYSLSLHSMEGSAHLHWHVASLSPGRVYERQQYYALMTEHGAGELHEPHGAETRRAV